jgi:hypothetical protein
VKFFPRRIKRPVEGHAEIVEAWQPHLHGQSGNCKMKLKLDVPGIAPQVVDHHEAVMTPNRWPEVGMRVAVTVDADHPDRVDVDWDSVFGERYGGVAGIGAEVVGAAVGLDLDLSKGNPNVEVDIEVPPEYEEQAAPIKAEYAAGRITYDEMVERLMQLMGMGT